MRTVPFRAQIKALTWETVSLKAAASMYWVDDEGD